MRGPKACNFTNKRLWHRCFPGNFAKFLRTLFLQNTSGRLLLFRVNRVSDYHTKSIYIKVFLWIIVLRMLVPSKILRICKNTWNSKLVRKYNTYYKWGAGLQPGTSPIVSFSRIFSIHFVSSKVRPPILFSTNSLFSIVIDKFANRNSCGYCFRRFRKFPLECLHWSSQ